ncbi:MAG TPA: alginate O-acetyltransferase [Desulfobulbus sp.]|nr:alginate O-acetyltransferase [Desulfobulbus sp.]
MKYLAVFFSVALVLLVRPGVSRAGEEALYAPRAPAGSAFIRLFNATPAAGAGGRLQTVQLRADSAYGASPYAFLPPGPGTLQAGGHALAVDLAANRSYTAVLLPDRLVLVDDPELPGRRKALLVLYNLTGSAHVSLRTRKKHRVVVGETASMSCSLRAVNPVRVELDVLDGDALFARAPLVSLERGRMFSLFVCGDRSAPVVVWVENGPTRGGD